MQFTAADAIALVALMLGLAKIFTGPIGVALAERIRGVSGPAHPALAGEMEELRGRVADVEERLDFAERLLAQAREADQLPGRAIS
jgi:F0F1-type ATP synthase membrane subunit b/b'